MTRNFLNYARRAVLGAIPALALLAGAVDVKADVSVFDMDTGTSATVSNQDYAANYSRALAERDGTTQVAGCFSPGGYNAGKCKPMAFWDKVLRVNATSNGGRSAGPTGN